MHAETKQMLLNAHCGKLIGAVGHHRHFTANSAARERLLRFRERILQEGAEAFFREEYPARSGKAFIVNVADGKACLVDGNAHLVSLVACFPLLKLSDLAALSGRTDIVRIWEDGWEEGSGQSAPYDVYVPVEIDTSHIPGARIDTDWFKHPPAPTKVIPPCISFDDPLFIPGDRGVPLFQTVRGVFGAKDFDDLTSRAPRQ